MSPIQAAKVLIGLGLFLLVAGLVVLVLGRLVPELGRLPGDLRWEGERTTVYFPLTTMLLVSLVASVLLSLLLWLFER